MNINEQLKTIRENLEAAEVDCYVSQLTDALYAFVPLLDAVEKVLAELDHAFANGHHLDRDCQGVGPGELVPAVRTENIEAAITTALEGK